MTVLLMVGELVVALAAVVLGYRVGRAAYAHLQAQLIAERAQLEAERQILRSHLAIVQEAAAEAVDAIEAMHGAARVGAVVDRWERGR